METQRHFLDSRANRAIINRLHADKQDAISILIAGNTAAEYGAGISAAEAREIVDNQEGTFALDDVIFGMEVVQF